MRLIRAKSGNRIGGRGGTKISEALMVNTTLTSLRLLRDNALLSLLAHRRDMMSLKTENMIGEEGAINMSEALKMNSSITELNLSGDYIAVI